MEDVDEIVAEFLVESNENLEQYDKDLLALEQDPKDREAIASVFRTMHTIKGTCGFLGFTDLEAFTHVAENLLGKLREGELQLDAETASLLLEAGDTVRRMLEVIRVTGAEDPNPPTHLLERLREATERTDRLGERLVKAGIIQEHDVALALHEQDLGDGRRIGEILVERSGIPADKVAAVLQSQAADRTAPETVRVDVSVLDELMTRVGELVLARNQIVSLTGDQFDGPLAAAAQRLDLITTELQEDAMKTRMQPIGNAWSRLPRVVRDLAQSSGKTVDFVREGEDTELDRTVLEAIKDPLTHLVRNAIDHGLETPEERTSAGKAEAGTLLLRAFHEGGQVHIEIRDDGRGVDVERIRAKAVERGMVSASQADGMAEREVLDLIFQPGFSTAAEVTNVSGRGVGMDVVRTNIEAIGGAVDIRSSVGSGTTFSLTIPLTLAIIPALTITAAGERYAIPQVNLVELVRVGHELAHEAVEYIHGAPVHRLRGRLLPLVHLSEVFGLAADDRDGSALNIVVLQADGRRFGLVVDGVSDTAEIVVKPLGRHLKSIASFAGATILGDGRVALILDVVGLARHVGVTSDSSGSTMVDDETAATAGSTTSLLVCGNHGQRVALPLSVVARLETLPASRIERVGPKEVVQYRGSIMPLVRLSSVLPSSGPPPERSPEQPLDVVVHATADGHVGLVVDQILDVVDVQLDLHPSARHGVRGTLTVDGHVTEVAEIDHLLAGVTTPSELVGA